MEKKIFCWMIVLMLCIIQVSALTINTVLANPKEVSPGEVSMIELGIENNGENNIEDVSVSLDLSNVPFAPQLSSSEFNFEEIEDSRIRYATFRIIALNDAESGIYKIPVKVSYKEEGETKVSNSIISMTINSKPLLSAGVEQGWLLKGKENVLPIKIVNKGLSNVKFLEIDIKKSSYYTITSPESVYIGDLDSDDFDSAEFKVYFKDNAPTSLKIPMVLKYRDSLNNELEETLDISMRVYSQENAMQLGLIKGNNIGIYVIIVVVLIIAFFVYRKIRKNRQRKKEKEE